MVSALPFGVETSRTAWQSKSIGLAIIFAYSLFQYSSAYRLYSFVAQLFGAMPPAQANDTAEADDHSKRTARVYEAATAVSIEASAQFSSHSVISVGSSAP